MLGQAQATPRARVLSNKVITGATGAVPVDSTSLSSASGGCNRYASLRDIQLHHLADFGRE
jgi:hypothetical protein